jgi:hypothetical protein
MNSDTWKGERPMFTEHSNIIARRFISEWFTPTLRSTRNRGENAFYQIAGMSNAGEKDAKGGIRCIIV